MVKSLGQKSKNRLIIDGGSRQQTHLLLGLPQVHSGSAAFFFHVFPYLSDRRRNVAIAFRVSRVDQPSTCRSLLGAKVQVAIL